MRKKANLIDASRTPSADHSAGVIEIVLVTAPQCHFCEEAKGALAELAQRYPLRIREVDLAEPEGTALVRRFRVPFPPIVMVDGAFFGHGRISRRKLEATLARASDGR